MTPARAIAWARLFVAAAKVRKMADMASVLRKVKRKKMKNCEGVYRWDLSVNIFHGEGKPSYKPSEEIYDDVECHSGKELDGKIGDDAPECFCERVDKGI
jgi:hypothetical protein